MRRTLVLTVLSSVALLAGLVACGGSQRAGSTAAPAPPPAVRTGTGATGTAQAPKAGDTALPPVPVVPSDKLIRTADITLEVRSGRFDDTLTRLIALTQQQGGYVSASTASTTGDRLREGVFTFSVPSAKFEATLGAIHDLGTIKAERLASQDVQQQYVDLQARLKNAEAQRDAMLALLQQAHTVSDILAVQNQLGQITAQIEQLKGQIDYLDHATGYSTVTVTLREAGVAAPPPSDLLTLRDAVAQGVHAFLAILGGILLVLVAVGPYVLVVAGAAWLWVARRRPSTKTE